MPGSDTAKIPGDFFADSLQLSQRHTITCQSPCPVTQGCSIPTARFGKDHTGDLISNDEPPLSHEDQSIGRFPPREGEKPERCVRGTSTGFWLEDKEHEISKARYKSGIFWLAFPRD